jgi:hypothetical protein
MAKEKKKTGRPPKPINKDLLESLAGLGARRKAIVDALDIDLKNQGGDGVTDNAVDRFCRREYGETFAEFLDKRKSMLETQLLNKAYTMIGTNSAVTIFFLKNVLGSTDKVEQTQTIKGDVPLVQVYLPDNGRDKT